MTQIEVWMPATTGQYSRVSEAAAHQFNEFESWFREQGVEIYRLSFGEIPTADIGAAYIVNYKNGMLHLQVYVEDDKLAMTTKLRWGGQFINERAA